MALQDNVAFAHFGDALTEDKPDSKGTQATPSGETLPGVSNGKLTFNGAQAITYQYGSPVFDPGTGDFTIAVRFLLNSHSSQNNLLIHTGTSADFSQHLIIYQESTSGGILAIRGIYSGTPIVKTPSGDNFLVTGQMLTAVFVREAGVMSIYDGTGTLLASDATAFDGYSVSTASDISLGAEYDGSRNLDGEIDFAVVWTRALTSTELQNNINETDLKNAILTSDTTAPTVTSPTSANVGETTADVGATSDEDGTGYAVVLPSGAAAPTGSQVVAGTDGADSPAAASGQVAATATTAFAIGMTGLTAGTAYDYYVTAEDAAGNVQQTPVSGSFTTAAAALTSTTRVKVEGTGAAVPNETGINAWFYENESSAPTDVWTGEETDGNGDLVLSHPNASGVEGKLVIELSDGRVGVSKVTPA